MLQCSGERMENLRQTIDQNRKTKAQLETECERLTTQCHEAKGRHRGATEVWVEAKQRLEGARQRSRDAENDMSNAAQVIDECKAGIRRLAEVAEHLTRKMRESRDRVVGLKQERNEAQRVCNASKESFVKPDEHEDPADLNQLPESALLQEAKRDVGNEVPTAEELNRKNAEFHTFKAKLAKWNGVYKRLCDTAKQVAIQADAHYQVDGRNNAHEPIGEDAENHIETGAALGAAGRDQEAPPCKKSKQVVQEPQVTFWLWERL
ncbi:hypothetical protein AAVH_23824 [Aphelenchoides avenae]|nr:hypothetical protein AAVH_23824 [Aphelenchus avenae]